MSILVAGSTGMLGGEIARRLAQKGEQVRGLVRPTSDASSIEGLRGVGVDVVEGDLKDRPLSIEHAAVSIR